jgi:hypothetical protein
VFASVLCVRRLLQRYQRIVRGSTVTDVTTRVVQRLHRREYGPRVRVQELVLFGEIVETGLLEQFSKSRGGFWLAGTMKYGLWNLRRGHKSA